MIEMAKKITKTSKKKLNETGRRSNSERRDIEPSAPTATTERRKSKRRRQIDPTTCEREYNDDEIEFMHALDEYKRASGRMFPTCSEILEVFVGLGYRKVSEPTEGFSFEKDDEDENQFNDSFDEEALESELEDQVV